MSLCLCRLSRTSSVTNIPIPPLFMYSSPLKFRSTFFVFSPPASAYASIQTPSQAAVTSHLMPITLALSPTFLTSIVTLSSGIVSLLLGDRGRLVVVHGHEVRKASHFEDVAIVIGEATGSDGDVPLPRLGKDRNDQRYAGRVDVIDGVEVQ